MEFKIGDTVEIIKDCRDISENIGKSGKITETNNNICKSCSRRLDYQISNDNNLDEFSVHEDEIKKINTGGVSMNVKTLAKRILDPKTRKLIKAGLLDDDLSLTEKGQSVLLSLLFIEHKTELLKEADEIIEEEKEEKDC